MPNINTSVDDLLLKSDRRFDFTTGSNKPVPLTTDPVVADLNDSNRSKVYAESFGDKATDPVELDHELVQRTVYKMGYEGLYPPTEKKLLHLYRRYLAHVITQCLSGRKRGYDVLNQTLSSCLVAIALRLEFNYSRMIFRDMHTNIKGKRKE
ncbi:hypothetical protein R6Q57_011307 [Mikania cordata]